MIEQLKEFGKDLFKEVKDVKRGLKTSGGDKLVIYLSEKDEDGNYAERQVVGFSSQFNPSYDGCKQLAQAIAGERKVYGFETI